MSLPPKRAVAVSVPGKVLIAGGYLVLDPAYFGLVVATSSRFYAIVTDFGRDPPEHPNEFRISFHSKQFMDAPSVYTFKKESLSHTLQTCTSPPTPNKFIDAALRLALTASMHLTNSEHFDSLFNKAHVEVTLVADNDFYSQSKELRDRKLTLHELSLLPPFLSTHTLISKVKKTGLGSSATLVTSLIASLLLYFTNTLPTELIHGLSQFTHCYAQGKIGSGFDVAAAVFGTHCYSRFSPSLVADFFELGPETPWPRLATFCQSMDAKVSSFQLPSHLQLFLADIASGSHTPSLVSTVLQWKSRHPDQAKAMWTHLHSLHVRLRALFASLASFPEVSKKSPLSTLLASLSNNHPMGKVLRDVTDVFQEIRQVMRDMGIASGTPIEPPEQTELLDACLKIPGVIGGGVPGAGGHDAIFLIYLSTANNEILPQLESLQKQHFPSVSPMLSVADTKGIVDETPLLYTQGSKLFHVISP